MKCSQDVEKKMKMKSKQEIVQKDFEIIDEDIINVVMSTDLNNIEEKDHNSEIVIMKRRNSNKSIWGNLKNSISRIKNNIIYNYLPSSNELKLEQYEWVSIYDIIFCKLKNKTKIKFDLSNIIWMSYRNGFNSIYNNDKKYYTDCGWGCMIRCAQMILAQGIFFIKNNEYSNKHSNVTKKDLDKKKILDILILFFDNNVSYSDLAEYNDSLGFINKISSKDFMVLDHQRSSSEIGYLTPAFSIHNICMKGIKYGKGAGLWFSDVNMTKIFEEINKEINVLKGLQIINFIEGVVYKSDIIKICFEEKFCTCNKSFKLIINDELNCMHCLENSIKFNNKIYRFLHPGIVFISIRLGLDKVDSKYFNSILRFFDITNNLGLIGGSKNRAFYFIGKTDKNQIIYLDPHFNQRSLKNITELKMSHMTYIPHKLFQMEIKNISPALTLGFFFRNLKEYEILMNTLTNFVKNEFIFSLCDNSFIPFKEDPENSN